MAIVIELGPDMSVFPSARHCAAWAGISPGNNEGAGERQGGRNRRGNPEPRAILIKCAHPAVRTRYGQFRSYQEAIKSRCGYQCTIVAVAHKFLRTIYGILRNRTPYANPRIDDEAISIGRKAGRWLRRFEQYGYVTCEKQEDQPDTPAQPA